MISTDGNTIDLVELKKAINSVADFPECIRAGIFLHERAYDEPGVDLIYLRGDTDHYDSWATIYSNGDYVFLRDEGNLLDEMEQREITTDENLVSLITENIKQAIKSEQLLLDTIRKGFEE